jgi:hypothetical protein
MKEKLPFKMKTNPDNASIELHLPFEISWKKNGYKGIIYLKLSAKSELLDYGIEWINKAPEFSHTEIEAFEKIEDDLADKIYSRLKNIVENLDLPEFETT